MVRLQMKGVRAIQGMATSICLISDISLNAIGCSKDG